MNFISSLNALNLLYHLYLDLIIDDYINDFNFMNAHKIYL